MIREEDGRQRLLARPPNLDCLLSRRTAFLRRYIGPNARSLEIGAGFGIASRYIDGLRLTSTDAQVRPWLDAAADAMSLPFRDATFEVVICLNVLHHLSYPAEGLREMVRVLRSGGRLFIVEPHASPMLRFFLALTRHEYVDWNVDPFGPENCQTRRRDDGGGNNAIGNILFDRPDRFRQAFPELIVEHDRFVECLVFLNSGGVGFAAPHIPLPRLALEWLGKLDDWLVRFPSFAMGREMVFRKV
jgi:SAM-dependent methyltransferase